MFAYAERTHTRSGISESVWTGRCGWQKLQVATVPRRRRKTCVECRHIRLSVSRRCRLRCWRVSFIVKLHTECGPGTRIEHCLRVRVRVCVCAYILPVRKTCTVGVVWKGDHLSPDENRNETMVSSNEGEFRRRTNVIWFTASANRLWRISNVNFEIETWTIHKYWVVWMGICTTYICCN